MKIIIFLIIIFNYVLFQNHIEFDIITLITNLICCYYWYIIYDYKSLKFLFFNFYLLTFIIGDFLHNLLDIEYNTNHYYEIKLIGSFLFFLLTITDIFLRKKPVTSNKVYNIKYFNILLISSFALTLVSYLNNYGSLVNRADTESDIDGAIVLLRLFTIPILYTLYISYNNLYVKKHKIVITYVLWLFFESITRYSSGGTLFFGLIPLILYFIYTNNFKKLKNLGILLSPFILLYPIIKASRQVIKNDEITNTYGLNIITDNITFFLNLIDLKILPLVIFDRLIYESVHDISLMLDNSSKLFFYNVTPLEVGASVYNTGIVHGLDIYSGHREGVSLLSESFMIGGIIGVILSLLILFLITHFIDIYVKDLFKKIISSYFVLIILFGGVTQFFTPSIKKFLIIIFSITLALTIKYVSNFKNKIS